ncbi:hypothetical protein AB1Y20_003097 [Prymnesium parvum]|uniref:Uncharacterized protein n=1 Tax=Prymnesium parvum TaxID=97485 RepID=A0AB34JCN0_PRYPA
MALASALLLVRTSGFEHRPPHRLVTASCGHDRAVRVFAQLTPEEEPASDEALSWRTPPPRGIPEPALSDRMGPFWTTLGEPDEDTGARPGFLRRNDWHISSIRTAEELEAEEEAMSLLASQEDVSLSAYTEEELGDINLGNPLMRSKHMQLEEFDIPQTRERTEAACPMPTSWQEYQFLQRELDEIASRADASLEVREAATTHLKDMADGYLQFKTILAEGWELEYDPGIEKAANFVMKMKQQRGA